MGLWLCYLHPPPAETILHYDFDVKLHQARYVDGDMLTKDIPTRDTCQLKLVLHGDSYREGGHHAWQAHTHTKSTPPWFSRKDTATEAGHTGWHIRTRDMHDGTQQPM